MDSSLIIAGIAAFLNIVVALLVLAKGIHKRLNKLFLLLVSSIVVWIVCTGISNFSHDVSISELFSRFSYGTSVLVIGFAYLFTLELSENKNAFKRFRVQLILTSMLAGLVLFSTGLVYNAITINTFSYGPLILPYYLTVLIGIGLISVELSKLLRSTDKIKRGQARLVVGALAITMILIGLVNLVLPIVYDSESITIVSPLLSIIFVAAVGYAITIHKLFDIKGIVIRSLVYGLTTAVLIVSYVLAAVLLKRLLLPNLTLSGAQFVSNLALTIILVILYPSVKKGFDKFTNRLFFRDSYDTQTFLDSLNKVLVTNIQIEELLRKSAQIIEQNIKSNFCSFFIRETSYYDKRFIGDYATQISESDIQKIQDAINKVHKKIIYTELEPDNEEEKTIIEILRRNDIDILVRIVSTLDYDVTGIGYILIGQKRSGNLFSKQDLGILEIIANELVIAAENALRFEEIEQFNVTLQKKIDDATKELKQSNDKLKALDEAKDEFVSMASHQLRTPLTSIKGYISMVLEGDAGDVNDSQKQMLGQALFSSQRMVYLISDLLNVSRLKTGKFVIEQKPVYLPDLIESEIQQLHEGAAAKNITLSFAKPESFPTVNLDEMKVRQVVMNFTDNAIYYTPNGGTITLGLKEKKDTVEFSVRDTGIGVPKSEQHKLFTKFYRAENAKKARPDGTGLGLFMAKKVIVAQGGSIIFDSKEGKGSTFGFSFPKKTVELDKLPPVDDSESEA
jgi:signal transduction histidine kinase